MPIIDYNEVTASGVDAVVEAADINNLETTTSGLQVWANGSTGDDDNDGWSELTPKKTIEAARDLLPPVLEHSCTMNLRGTFVLDNPATFTKIQKSLLSAILVVDGGPDTEVLGGPYTSTAASTSSIADSSQSWTANEHAGSLVEILSGPAAGETRGIFSNDGSTLVPTTAWSTSPGTAASFQISQPATRLTAASTYSFVMSCTPLNTYQNYPSLQRMTLLGKVGLFHSGGALVLSHIVSRSTYPTPYRLESPGNCFLSSFITDPVTHGFSFVTRCPISSIGSGTIRKEDGILTNAGFIVNGGSILYDNCFVSKAGGVSHVIGNVTIQNSIVQEALQVLNATGVGLKSTNSIVNVTTLQVDNCSSHAIEIDGGRLVHSAGASTGSGNTGAGLYAHSQGVIHTKAGSVPTVTGTIGDVSIDGTTQKSLWSTIESGTPINGATVGNDEFVIVKKV